MPIVAGIDQSTHRIPISPPEHVFSVPDHFLALEKTCCRVFSKFHDFRVFRYVLLHLSHESCVGVVSGFPQAPRDMS